MKVDGNRSRPADSCLNSKKATDGQAAGQPAFMDSEPQGSQMPQGTHSPRELDTHSSE